MRFWAWLGRMKAALGRWWQRLFGTSEKRAVGAGDHRKALQPGDADRQEGHTFTDAEFEEVPEPWQVSDEHAKSDQPTATDQAETTRLAEEARVAEEARLAEEALAEEALAEEALAEEARLAETARHAEAARLAEESRLAEEQEVARLAEEQEVARLAEEQRQAEETRLAEEQRQAEAARIAEEQQAARIAEEQRQAEVARLAEKSARAETERQRDLARHRAAGIGVAVKAFDQLARIREREAERALQETEENARMEQARADRERHKLLRDLARHAATRAGVAHRAFSNLLRLREEEAARAYREAHRFVRRRSIEAQIAVRAFIDLEEFRELEAEEELRRQAEEEERVRVEAEQAAERERKRRVWEQVEIPRDYAPAPESNHEIYHLDLDSFEGPLDLLLFLIRRHKLDIFDIPMAFICEQYLEYIQMMQDLNIDVASEFMFMAAELLHIKSKMLLPRPADVDDEEEDIDPRAELVRRLLEYQKYKGAALSFGDSPWLNRDTFAREPERIEIDRRSQPLREVGVFALIEAFDHVLERQKPEFRHQVMMEQSSVAERVRQVVAILAGRGPTPFTELLGPVRSRLDVVVSFLAMLEMTKMHMLRIYESIEGILYIKPRFESIEVAMQQIEQIDDTIYAG